MVRQSVEARFWSKVEKSEGCWLWTGSRHPRGFGRFHVDCRVREQLAHRVAYELTFGEIPPGLCVLQQCENPLCVNPAHLTLGRQGAEREAAPAREPGSDLEAENRTLRDLLAQARLWFISGWRHQRPLAYLRFRRQMNAALGIPPDD